MANHTKFVSVNLNKSYGKSQSLSSSLSSSSYALRPLNGGLIGSSRGRSGGGGMVVLSRPRSAGQKSTARLAVPPPLNLPSLKKEHERQDSAAKSGPLAGFGSSGLGNGHSGSGMGWSKPVVVHTVSLEKEGDPIQSRRPDSGDKRSGSSASLPLASGQSLSSVRLARSLADVGKAAVLRGEDFPSLLATIATPEKVASNQKQKQKVIRDEVGNGQDVRFDRRSPLPMHPQIRSSSFSHKSDEKELSGERDADSSSGGGAKKLRGMNGFLHSPLDTVRLSHTSDWADDERDTSHGMLDRGRDKGFSRNEIGRAHGNSDGRAGYDIDIGKAPFKDLYGKDSFGRDLSISGRNEGSWKSSQLSRDGSVIRENGVDRGSSGVCKPFSLIRDSIRDVRHGHSHHADSSWKSTANGIHDTRLLIRDSSYGRNFQTGRNGPEAYNSRNIQKNDSVHGRYNDTYNNRDMHFFQNSGKPLMEDTSFDNGDPFLGSSIGDVNIKVLRKKKDNLSNIELHDPVRDSFEAELERVQRMQEEERKQVLEEKARVLELARREEEEKHRMIREEKERRQRLEDEAREATWRAEQERLEAEKKAEQQRLAREEEKRRIAMEEERRKEAAHQKLLELEARILKRQAEAAAKDLGSPVNAHVDQHPVKEKEKEMPNAADNGDWEDSECMVEQITSSTLLDSSSLNRGIEITSMSNSSKEGNAFKYTNPWRKDADDIASTSAVRDNSCYISQQDAFGIGRSKKTISSNPEAVSVMTSSKEGKSDFYHARGHGWENTGNSDQFYRNSDFGNAFPDNENYSGTGFVQTRPRGSSHPPYSDSILHTPDVDCFASFGRLRHVIRQPHVLPPPRSFRQRSSFKASPEHLISSAFWGSETRYDTADRNGEKITEHTCESECLGKSWQLGNSSLPQDNESEEHGKSTPRCDTQSSVSISSPPTSPGHLSHNDLDESGDLCSLPTSTSGMQVPLSNDVHQKAVVEIVNSKPFSDSSSTSLRDEDEWTVENNDEIQDLEEYDEDGDLEDEVHQVTCENFKIAQDIECSHMVQDQAIEMEQMVLGFNEGVEVKIPCNDDFEGAFDSSVTNLQSKDPIFPNVIKKSPDNIEDMEKPLKNMVIEPVDSANCPVGSSDGFVSSEMPPKQPDESVFQARSLPTSAIFNSVSPAKPQSEPTHRELQFGLFSGPSLIPSPIPAIQIGSIQMPLHLHPPLGASITHMHSSQSSLFQFGQLHYPSPLSQGVLPLTQSMPFIQPSVPAQSTFNMNLGNILHNNALSHPASQDMHIGEKVVGNNMKPSDVSHQKHEIKDTSSSSGNVRDVLDSQEKATKSSYGNYEKHKTQGAQNAISNVPYQISPGGQATTQSRSSGILSTERGKRYVYTVKSPSSGSQFPGADASLLDHNYVHRRLRRNVRQTVFRVKESGSDVPDTNATTGISANSMPGRGAYSSRSTKLVGGLKSVTAGECLASLNSKTGPIGKEAVSKKIISSSIGSQFRDRNLRSNGIFKDVLDAPLQSGFIQIFKQPGIEVPSDEDDFIEVRSKRQMLNDKREQKEKETKAKSRVAKGSRKLRSFSQSSNAMSSANKLPSPVGIRYANKVSGGTGLVNQRTSQTSTGHVASSEEVKLVPELVSEDHDTAVHNVNSSSDSWDKDPVNLQVIALTQNQLDDAMKPAPFDTCMASTSNNSDIVMDGGMPSTSSTSGNLNSLLPVGKIQFGAITTPAILPPVLRAVNQVIGATGSSSCHSDFSVDGNLSSRKHDPIIFFEKEKDCAESSDQLDEAEAAASAIAVAAFCNDEIVQIGLNPRSSSSENNNFTGVNVNSLSSRGGSNIQEVPSQSGGDEPLSVTLPADLSVEPPSISSWPAFASQSSSGPLLSNVPGAPTNFPFFNMNSMIGGPMFAYGSNDETGSSQSQEQKTMVLGSGTLGAWPQCHSGVESFYGPPTGFPGPFVNSQGGIPGIQPPQMIFYNPFAPVGQYSLSFMGATTYIPPGKQPDWKHNPVSSTAGVSDGDVNNLNVSDQRSHASVSPSIQHLGQIAPLMPITPQLPMFDMPPFQSSAEIPLQARWPHLSIPPPNSVTVPVQLEHYHVNGGAPSQNGHSMQEDSSATKSRFPESSSTEPTDCSRNFNNIVDHVAQYTRELGVVEKPSSVAIYAQQRGPYYGSGGVNNKEGSSSGKNSGSTTAVGRSESANIISLGNCGNNTNLTSTVKASTSSQSQQHIRPIGYADHRARLASPQNVIHGNEWHRRTGVHGKSNNLGAEKSFPTSKVKQVYVAKQPAGGPATTE